MNLMACDMVLQLLPVCIKGAASPSYSYLKQFISKCKKIFYPHASDLLGASEKIKSLDDKDQSDSTALPTPGQTPTNQRTLKKK